MKHFVNKNTWHKSYPIIILMLLNYKKFLLNYNQLIFRGKIGKIFNFYIKFNAIFTAFSAEA